MLFIPPPLPPSPKKKNQKRTSDRRLGKQRFEDPGHEIDKPYNSFQASSNSLTDETTFY